MYAELNVRYGSLPASESNTTWVAAYGQILTHFNSDDVKTKLIVEDAGSHKKAREEF